MKKNVDETTGMRRRRKRKSKREKERELEHRMSDQRKQNDKARQVRAKKQVITQEFLFLTSRSRTSVQLL